MSKSKKSEESETADTSEVETTAPMHDEAYAPKPPCTCDEDQRIAGDVLRRMAAVHAELSSAGERK